MPNLVGSALRALSLCSVLAVSGNAYCQPIPKDLVDYWRANAPYCVSANGTKFPSKKRDDGSCDDGDTTIFAGLLCASGDSLACDAVRQSQDATGRWFRSPRRRETANMGEPNSFSPDMALGAQLYAIARSDGKAIESWLRWMDESRPCWIGNGANCVKGILLRFCTDDTEKGCTVRPTDGGVLRLVAERLGIKAPSQDVNHLLEQFAINIYDLIWAGSQLNKPGYSRHLVAAEILLLRRAGFSNPKLDGAAFALASKHPSNPFFLYLAGRAPAEVAAAAMAVCPAKNAQLPKAMIEWTWERDESDEAWHRSMIWDCIFISNLLSN
jgi:hypothetical protein